jgi:hypothetical protein
MAPALRAQLQVLRALVAADPTLSDTLNARLVLIQSLVTQVIEQLEAQQEHGNSGDD